MEFIMQIVIALGVLLIVAIVAGISNIIMSKKHNKFNLNKISFKESMDLVDLPIITFVSNGVKLNFLLDTGATYSAINSDALKNLKYTPTDNSGTSTGIGGDLGETYPYIKLEVNHRGKVYDDEFQVLDLSSPFKNVKESSGITLHGILGNSFFQKYRYVLNFDEFIAYSVI